MASQADPVASPDIAGLAALIAPLAVDDIRGLIAERKPKLVRSAADGFDALPRWPELRDALAADRIPRKRMRVVRDGLRIAEMFYTGPDGIRFDSLEQLVDNGSTLILESLDDHLERVRVVSDALRAASGDLVSVSGVVTTGTRGALNLHFDEEDILAFQVEGTKGWRIYEPTTVNPLKHCPQGTPPSGPPLLELDLHPGDMLFVPAGFWHQCANMSERSLHYSAMFIPLSITDVMSHLHEHLAADAHWRRPLSRAGDLGAVQAELHRHLGSLLDAFPLETLARERLSRKEKKTPRA